MPTDFGGVLGCVRHRSFTSWGIPPDIGRIDIGRSPLSRQWWVFWLGPSS